MEKEVINATCQINDAYKNVVIELEEDAVCKISYDDGKNRISVEADHFWGALINLRQILELKNIRLLCKGCSKNVYPSPMILDMGDARVAYRMILGQQVHKEDLVYIFDSCTPQEYATIEEQEEFYHRWCNSFSFN